jgi:hypothetical protein
MMYRETKDAKKAFYYKFPIKIVEHWITELYGFTVFNSADDKDKFVYVTIDKTLVLKVTQEFIDDIPVSKQFFKDLKIKQNGYNSNVQ